MSLFAPPTNLTLNEGLHAIFSHYCSPWKSDMGNTFSDLSKDEASSQGIDGAGFAKMCREAPGLTKIIGRAEVDLIFNSARSTQTRRLDYEHFLLALLELACKIFPEVNPTNALSNFLARYIFALYDQPPAPASMNVIETIYLQLLIHPN